MRNPGDETFGPASGSAAPGPRRVRPPRGSAQHRGHRLPLAGQLGAPLGGGRGEPRGEAGLGEQAADRVAQRGGVPGGHEQRGVADDVRDAADGGGDDRQPGLQRLLDASGCPSQRLGTTTASAARSRSGTSSRGPSRRTGRPSPADPRPQLGFERAAPGDHEQRLARVRPGGRVEQRVQPLLGGEPGDGEQDRPRPGRELGPHLLRRARGGGEPGRRHHRGLHGAGAPGAHARGQVRRDGEHEVGAARRDPLQRGEDPPGEPARGRGVVQGDDERGAGGGERERGERAGAQPVRVHHVRAGGDRAQPRHGPRVVERMRPGADRDLGEAGARPAEAERLIGAARPGHHHPVPGLGEPGAEHAHVPPHAARARAEREHDPQPFSHRRPPLTVVRSILPRPGRRTRASAARTSPGSAAAATATPAAAAAAAASTATATLPHTPASPASATTPAPASQPARPPAAAASTARERPATAAGAPVSDHGGEQHGGPGGHADRAARPPGPELPVLRQRDGEGRLGDDHHGPARDRAGGRGPAPPGGVQHAAEVGDQPVADQAGANRAMARANHARARCRPCPR